MLGRDENVIEGISDGKEGSQESSSRSIDKVGGMEGGGGGMGIKVT